MIYTLSMLIRRLLGLDTVSDAIGVINRQQDLIAEWKEAYDAQQARLTLQHTRNVRDLVQHFLIAVEEEIDVRDQLEAGLQDLKDHVARLEEQCR